MKRITQKTVAAIALMTISHGGEYIGVGNWDSVRLYGHSLDHDGYSATDYNNIKNNFALFGIAKSHGQKLYLDKFGTTATTEYASKVAANKIVSDKSTTKPLFYWNSAHVYDWQYANLERAVVNNPQFFYDDDVYVSDVGYTFVDDRAENWWAKVANTQIRTSKLAGTFVDGVPRSQRQGKLEKVHNVLDKLDGLVIYNGYQAHGNGFYAGPETLAHADGVFVEAFFRQSVKTEAQAETLLDNLLEVPANKYIITRASADNVWSRNNNFRFHLAAFLIIANDYSFFSYSPVGSDYLSAYVKPFNNADFSRRLGKPLGKATKNANLVYRRSFKYADVTVNLKTKTSNIKWK